jgi:hypothetical protein
MMDLVELQHVIIAVERDRDVWGVMDEVVGSPVADAVDGNAVAIHAVPAAIVVDVVVVGDVASRGERFAAAAAEDQPDVAAARWALQRKLLPHPHYEFRPRNPGGVVGGRFVA